MKWAGFIIMSVLVFFPVLSCSSSPTTETKLREWQRGVWLSDGGAYSIWTETHYFVVSAAGDSTQARIYCGSSRVRFTEKGVARHQNLRVRQSRQTALNIIGDFSMYLENEQGGVGEEPLEIDMDLFKPGACNVVDGVIYDSVTEETSDYILLSSCNGDQIKLFSNGRFLYLSSDGSESWSYRIESF